MEFRLLLKTSFPFFHTRMYNILAKPLSNLPLNAGHPRRPIASLNILNLLNLLTAPARPGRGQACLWHGIVRASVSSGMRRARNDSRWKSGDRIGQNRAEVAKTAEIISSARLRVWALGPPHVEVALELEDANQREQVCSTRDSTLSVHN